ncbi:MAG: MarR family transcriptional regulator [Clostridiales bacterium]|nr:MarR family transcriptional regulator [Clostridiales bacterium]
MSDIEVSCAPVWFARIRKAIQRRHIELLKPYGLSSIHAMYLTALYHSENGMTLRELCDQLFVDKANTSRAITTLETNGYVEKEGNDKLRYRIKLTLKGHEVAQLVVTDMRKVHDIMFRSVTEDEKDIIRKVMQKVERAADDI